MRNSHLWVIESKEDGDWELYLNSTFPTRQHAKDTIDSWSKDGLPGIKYRPAKYVRV